VCAVLHLADRRLEVTNAGHLPILVATTTGARFLDERADPPLGVNARRRPVGYQLTADTSVFFLTDGLVERRGASIEEGLGAALEVARQLTGGSAGAAELARRVTDRLGQPEDDATVVSLRLLAAHPARDNGPRVSLRLFVDPADIRSARAERVARELAGAMGRLVQFELEVVDITVSADAAEEEGVMAAPTVVRVLPAPRMRVVGNVGSPGELARALQLPHAEEVDL
jgi:circadian clock protein KaiB